MSGTAEIEWSSGRVIVCQCRYGTTVAGVVPPCSSNGRPGRRAQYILISPSWRFAQPVLESAIEVEGRLEGTGQTPVLVGWWISRTHCGKSHPDWSVHVQHELGPSATEQLLRAP
jgi:hypothetical protein